MLKILKLLFFVVFSFSFLTYCKTSNSKSSGGSPSKPTTGDSGSNPGGLAPVDPTTDSIPQVASDLHNTMSDCVASQGGDTSAVPSASELATAIQTSGTAAAAAAVVGAQGGTCKDGQTDNCIPADSATGTTTTVNPNGTLTHGKMWLFLVIPGAIATAVSAGVTIRNIMLYAKQYRAARASGKLPTGPGTPWPRIEGSPTLAIAAESSRNASSRSAGAQSGRTASGLSVLDDAAGAVADAPAADAASSRSSSSASTRRSSASSGYGTPERGGMADFAPLTPKSGAVMERAPSTGQLVTIEEASKATATKTKGTPNYGRNALIGVFATAAFAGITIGAASQMGLADTGNPQTTCANNLDLLEARYLNLLGK